LSVSLDGEVTSSDTRLCEILPAGHVGLTVTEPAEAAILGTGDVRWVGTVSPPASGRLVLDGREVPYQDAPFDVTRNVADGDRVHRLEFHPVNGPSVTLERRVIVDTTPPVLDLGAELLQEVTVEEPRIRVQGRVRDLHPSYVRIDGSDHRTGADGRFDRTLDLEPGAARTLVLRGFDGAGNASETRSIRVVHQVPEPRTLSVPDEVPTLASAMKQARPGDTILLRAGRHAGAALFRDGVRLIGDDAGTAVVEVPASGPPAVLALDCGFGAIEGITFRGTTPGTNDPPPGDLGVEFRWAPDLREAIVATVGKESAAARAGIRLGEVITAFDGVAVRDGPYEAAIRIQSMRPGASLRVGVRGPGGSREVDLKVGSGAGYSKAGSGVVLLQSNVHVERCRFENLTDGWTSYGTQAKPRIADSVFDRCSGRGIDISLGSNASVEGNTCTGCGIGISICGRGTSPLISGNRCFKNQTWGVVW
jgi:parallel beta-helix repeat protein